MPNIKIFRNKSCGCLIGSSVVSLEVQRRKNLLKLGGINKKLKKLKDAKKILRLKKEKAALLKAIKDVHANKQKMKSRFHSYIKKSGYVPPKFKNKKR